MFIDYFFFWLVSHSHFFTFLAFLFGLWALLMFSCCMFGFCCLPLGNVWVCYSQTCVAPSSLGVCLATFNCLSLPELWPLILLLRKTSVLCFGFPLCSMAWNIPKREVLLKVGQSWGSPHFFPFSQASQFYAAYCPRPKSSCCACSVHVSSCCGRVLMWSFLLHHSWKCKAL